jgi:hypothetical protein
LQELWLQHEQWHWQGVFDGDSAETPHLQRESNCPSEQMQPETARPLSTARGAMIQINAA